MHRKRTLGAFILLGCTLVIASAVALSVFRPANAQCGSQASSCKNCHETQAKLTVNGDGTGWHQSHAFGDFCYICHGGNNQAMEELAAHTGMVPPMNDVQTACAQCHPNDLQARSDVYTVALGMPNASVRESAPATAAALSAAIGAPETTAEPPAPPAASPAAGDPNLVDYVAKYDSEVLNQQPINWGNLILIVLLVVLLGVGLFFVNRREGWLSISFSEKRAIDKEYPTDVAGIADQIARLSPSSRRSLSNLLNRPAAVADILAALDRFSTDVRSGDK